MTTAPYTSAHVHHRKANTPLAAQIVVALVALLHIYFKVLAANQDLPAAIGLMLVCLSRQ